MGWQKGCPAICPRPRRGCPCTADTEFDLTVGYVPGEDTAVVHIPLSRDCEAQAHFEISGLRALAP
ncbi:hypothetical protein ACFY3O_27950 [Streptomyces sp. NPDC001046]|uniref:hypothetical protein n=1 Tax=Streptomyces sp. NPDC001046 TaxID=3364543 RepID=UPI0036D13610